MGKDKKEKMSKSDKKDDQSVKILSNKRKRNSNGENNVEGIATRSRSGGKDGQPSSITTPSQQKAKRKKVDCRKVLIKEQDSDANNNATVHTARINTDEDEIDRPCYDIPRNSTQKANKLKKIIHENISITVTGGGVPKPMEQDEEELDYVDDVDRDSPDENSDSDSEESSDEESDSNDSADDAESEVILNKNAHDKRERLQKEQLQEDDPRVQKLLDKLLAEKIQKGELKPVKDKANKNKKLKKDKRDKGEDIGVRMPTIKSPSDTTIYMPALTKNNNRVIKEMGQQHVNNDQMNNISQFIEGMRLQQKRDEDKSRDASDQSSQIQPQPGTSRDDDQDMSEAREKASKAILDAEQYKAMVDDTRGRQISSDSYMPEYRIGSFDKTASGECFTADSRSADQSAFANMWPQVVERYEGDASDDAFFHITCHVDPKLRRMIERGEFVELDKLLPKNRFRKKQYDGKFRWIMKGSDAFLSPVENESGISGIRKWEQAFRVYATIYSKANPHRSAEIWQYIHVINVASATYIWDNVAEYDFAFRQLMHCNPKRSWAKTYNQIWNLTLREHIPLRGNGYGGGYGNGYNSNNGYNNQRSDNGHGQSGGNSNHNGKKTRHCWKFNRSGHCPDGKDCNWWHRCKYCDGTSHGYNTCRKRGGNNNQNTVGNKGSDAPSTSSAGTKN